MSSWEKSHTYLYWTHTAFEIYLALQRHIVDERINAIEDEAINGQFQAWDGAQTSSSPAARRESRSAYFLQSRIRVRETSPSFSFGPDNSPDHSTSMRAKPKMSSSYWYGACWGSWTRGKTSWTELMMWTLTWIGWEGSKAFFIYKDLKGKNRLFICVF